MKLNSDERKFNALSRGIPILTIGSTFGAVFGGQKLLILSVIAFILSLIIFVKALQDASKTVRKRDELNHRFMHDYTCPICHRFSETSPTTCSFRTPTNAVSAAPNSSNKNLNKNINQTKINDYERLQQS